MMDFKIGNRPLGPGHPTYIIAELSANHGQDFDLTVRIIEAMKEAGADAVKVQTYTADTMTIASDKPPFLIGGGTLWDGRTLHDLYQEAYMPWEWQPKLKKIANDLGMDFFSTPFDASAVDFLEAMDVEVHKIASFELVDLPLLRKIAATKKPIIMSTGMSTLEEISEAIETLRSAGSGPIVLLKCTSAYPASPDEMDLRTIQDMSDRFQTFVGLSDHTLGSTVAVAAVALGACVVEKHFTLSRATPGPDSSFSMEPQEFREMVDAIRITEQALGRVNYEVSPKEMKSRVFRRSLFAVADIAVGEAFTAENVRVIRPAHGLHPRHLEQVLGTKAKVAIEHGTPLSWDLVEGAPSN
ncbi:pseudaminic acid synthase [Brevifollis gellanilyticus]|uniref:Sialic acid synthase n=1 Tax=Brevifollis gellanilyticus TaxID=748831 RepID=A0A512M6X0_9BACT|nr:pseudaminic acid synthase [Brevifollis gellanilyticus]GEP42477.1 sialic acid synthase [Brevifollis gellanilyticus]